MSPEPGTIRPLSPLPRGLTLLIGTAAFFLAISGMRNLAGIIGPVFFALTLTIAVYPLRTLAGRWGLPGWAGTALGVLAVYTILLGMTAALIFAIARFAALIPTYQSEFNDLGNNVAAQLKDLGVGEQQLHQMGQALDPDKLAGWLEAILAGLVGVASNLFFVIAVILFMGVDATRFPEKFAQATEDRISLHDGLLGFASGTRKYFVVATAFGLVVAGIDTLVLALLGVPEPLLWGLLAFITNYIPNVGFIIGLVPPAVLALLDSGPGLMLAVIVAYSVINAGIQSVIQPRVVGSAVGISATVSFLSLVFWSYVLGAYGTILAIPLTLLVKTVLVDIDPGTRWISPLISDDPRPVKVAKESVPDKKRPAPVAESRQQ